MTTATVAVSKEAIIDLVRVKDEFDTIVESLELIMDKEFKKLDIQFQRRIKVN